MKILSVISTLDPAQGGPVEVLRNFVIATNVLGHYNEVVTLDTGYVPWLECYPCRVHALGPGLWKYRYNPRLLPWLLANVDRFDAVIVHGIWQYHSFATWLASRKISFPYFVFPHGALDPWFKYTYPLKHIKKWLYWPWAEYRVLRDAKAVLFCSIEEKKRASKSFWLYRANEVVLSYGINAPSRDHYSQCQKFLEAYPRLMGKHFVLFLGRIHPVKGCDLLVEAFARTIDQYPDLYLVIAGPDQIGWQSVLKKRAKQLGTDQHIIWTGMLQGDLKWGAYYAADVFILPSHSENFGVAVVEALACHLPVLITDKVNIWREIKDDNAGIVNADTTEGITRLLQEWLRLSESERKTMRENAYNCFLRRFHISKMAEDFVTMVQNTDNNR